MSCCCWWGRVDAPFERGYGLAQSSDVLQLSPCLGCSGTDPNVPGGSPALGVVPRVCFSCVLKAGPKVELTARNFPWFCGDVFACDSWQIIKLSRPLITGSVSVCPVQAGRSDSCLMKCKELGSKDLCTMLWKSNSVTVVQEWISASFRWWIHPKASQMSRSGSRAAGSTMQRISWSTRTTTRLHCMQQVRESHALCFFAAHRTRPYGTALRKCGNKLIWMKGKKGDSQ